MRTIGVVTGGRSDYGIYLPVLRQIQNDPDLELRMIVTGMHLSPEFGLTVEAIMADGFEIFERIETLLSSDSPEGLAKSVGLGVIGFAQLFARFRPDILLVLGDRFEMYAAAVAALPFRIPLAHIHGGETTEGSIDEAIRHSITKMSHLHFAATETYASRIVQMGEQPRRVFLTGAPALDSIKTMEMFDCQELKRRFQVDLSHSTLLVTFHPVTLEYEQTEAQIEEVLEVLALTGYSLVFTYPNADTCGRLIIEKILEFVSKHERCYVFDNLGPQAYFSLMNHVVCMVGNSSSGIIEAASFRLPVVNIGKRQRGRLRGENVIDVECDRKEILPAIERATSAQFRASLKQLANPYGDGHAAERIVEQLREITIDDELLMKRFYQAGTNS